MRRRELSRAEIFLWTSLGAGAGLLAGFALSEWVGDVNRGRLGRAARRIQAPAPRRPRPSLATTTQAAGAALLADALLCDLGLEARAISERVVELRGWAPSRAARTRAARVVCAVAGIDRVLNSILVRGEDDRVAARDTARRDDRATDQTA